MTPQELKNSILQLAIQGKLVEQRPEEGTAAELFKQIQAEKQSLIKAGKLKKEKPLPPISDDEKPFDIPESWMWVRLDDLVVKEIKRGKSPVYVSQSNTLVFAQKCNTKAGNIDLSLALFLDETKLSKYPESEFMQSMDIIINSTGNGTLGRVGIYQDSDNPKLMPIVPDSHVTVVRSNKAICTGYVFYTLKYYQPYMEKLGSGSTNQTELSANIIKSLVFPLPPLSEQKRIVAKIEELLPLIDRYDVAWSRLEDFNKRFPNDMQKSILQMAIQGKLVEQRPEEGTAEDLYKQIQSEKQSLIKAGKLKKEKPLPPITDDEIPFEIPESWKWVRLPEIGEINRGRSQHRPRNAPELYVNGKYPFIQTGDVAQTDYHISEWETMYNEQGLAQSRLWPKGTLCLTIAANIGDVAILDFDACFPDSVVGFNAYLPITSNLFVMYGLMCYKNYLDQLSRSTAQKNINLEILSKVAFPLPPLAEQKRIVAKIEELLPLCIKIREEI